jgi:cysteine-rich secretory family protein
MPALSGAVAANSTPAVGASGRRSVFLAVASGGVVLALLLGGSQAALAVKASPPTVQCTAQCEGCIEMEHTPEGGRCVKCGVDPSCLGDDGGLYDAFTAMLQAHNGYRAAHGTPPLTWSRELAKSAQDWANKCTPDPQDPGRFAHSPEAFNRYGENMYWTTSSTDTGATNAVNWWYEEVNRGRYDFTNPYASFIAGDGDRTKEVRHFTQVVWRDTKEIGCAVGLCTKPGEPTRQLWVCQYGPPGNFNAQNPGVLDWNVPKLGGLANKSRFTIRPGRLDALIARPPDTGVPKLPGAASPAEEFREGSTRCYSNMVPNAAGRCECPTGTTWAGRRCMTFAFIPTQKVPNVNIARIPDIPSIPGPATQSTVPARPVVTGIAPSTAMAVRPRCRWPRPVGTPPNCCPLHTYYSNGACRTLARLNKPTVVATPTVVAPPPVVAKPGGSEKPQRQSPGASGTAVVQPRRCPPSRPVGTPPYCCQRGAQYINGVGCRGIAGVVRAQAPAPQCAAGMIRRADGSCGCPQGLTGSGCKFPLVK